MADFIACTNENFKENSSEPINIDNTKDTQHNSNSIIKKAIYNERCALYKKPIKKDNYKLEVDFDERPQEIRRQELLIYQKQNRDACINASRGLSEEIFYSDEELEMDVEQVKQLKPKVYKKYGNMLTLSEWMLEVPQDFAENWIMVPCPIGKRVIIIASQGVTKMFTRRGFKLSVNSTALPGGNRQSAKNCYTVLDAIWLKDKNTCYVLDVLAWSKQEMINCAFEFRLYWLKSEIGQLNQLSEEIKGINDFKILLLPSATCDQNFYECLKSIPCTITLDGLLFYHKEANYVSGRTPLISWLKTYMLPEVLGMDVPEPYDEKPNSYIDFEHHVLKINNIEKQRVEKLKKLKKQWRNREQDME